MLNPCLICFTRASQVQGAETFIGNFVQKVKVSNSKANRPEGSVRGHMIGAKANFTSESDYTLSILMKAQKEVKTAHFF